MITTRTAVKALLGITDTSKDTRIDALLPQVEADLIGECNKDFLTAVSFAGNITPTAAAGSVYSFDCADGGMDDVFFTVGDVVKLQGSMQNEWYFTIAAIADAKITVTEQVFAEAEGYMALVKAQFPREFPLLVAKMVAFQLSTSGKPGMESEKILDYSYTRKASSGSYPEEILAAIRRYKATRVGIGSVVQHYNDKRGNWRGGHYDRD
jgi:hypothetical protein